MKKLTELASDSAKSDASRIQAEAFRKDLNELMSKHLNEDNVKYIADILENEAAGAKYGLVKKAMDALLDADGWNNGIADDHYEKARAIFGKLSTNASEGDLQKVVNHLDDLRSYLDGLESFDDEENKKNARKASGIIDNLCEKF